MTGSIDTHPLFEALKVVLKSRGIRYSQVAEELDLAESSVKRMFSLRNCSMDQFSAICNIAGISLPDLVQMAQNTQTQQYILDHKIEVFFSQNIDYFLFYRQIIVHQDLNKAIRAMAITRKDAHKILNQLEKFQLLELHPNDRIKFLKTGYLKISERGPLKSALYKHWLPQFIDESLENLHHPSYHVHAFSTRLTPQMKANFIDEYQQLIEKTLKIAQLETRVGNPNLEPMGVVFASTPKRIGI